MLQQALSGKATVDKLEDDFEIVFTFRATCARLPDFSYRDHMEMWVLSKEMSTLEFPTMDQWKEVENFGRTKYTLHAQG